MISFVISRKMFNFAAKLQKINENNASNIRYNIAHQALFPLFVDGYDRQNPLY